MTSNQEYICNQLKENGPSYFSLDNGYGVVSSLTPEEKKEFAGSDNKDAIIKMQKYDNEDNLLMTVYSYCGRIGEFYCSTNDGMKISFAFLEQQSFPIKKPEREFVKWLDNENNYVQMNYNVGNTKEKTKINFMFSAIKQGVPPLKALKMHRTIREVYDFQKEGTSAIYRDGICSKNELPRFNKSEGR